MLVGAGHMQASRARQIGDVVARRQPVRSGLPETGQRAVDESRIEVFKPRPVEAEPV